MHIQHDIPSQEVTDAAPVTLYTVPTKFKLKMTEVCFTNPTQLPVTIELEDTDGINTVSRLLAIIPAGETVMLTGFMRHFAKMVVAINSTANSSVVVSSSGYLC
jgi:ActR/RegA family two-component response regulator